MNEEKRTTPRFWPWSQNTGLNKAKNSTAPAIKKSKRMSEEINRRTNDRVKMEMGALKDAIESAKDVNNPIRYNLYLLYDNAITDSEVRSQAKTSTNKLIAEPFMIAVNGKDDPKLADLLHRPWFEKLLRFIFWSEMYGYTLVEFSRLDKSGEFKDCDVFPRIHVRPDKKEILMDPFVQRGTYIGDVMQPLGLVELGDPSDLGVLETITREVIWKNFSRSDWASFSEKFGQPLITMTTEADGEELNKRINMLRNFASSGWVVGEKDSDTFDLKEPASRNGAHELFMQNILMADRYIGKLINGQTGTASNEAWAGSAGVHERIMDDIHNFRLRMATNVINYELIPFLNYWGYPLQGATFRFPLLDAPEEIQATPAKQASPQNRINKVVSQRQAVAAAKIDKMLDEYLQRIYDGQTQIDPTIWRFNFDKLISAILESGLTFNVKHKLYDLAVELRTNAATFAAFKNHRETEQLAQMLTDDKGAVRSFSEFKKTAKPITQDYNINWLETEYTDAIQSAQMAQKWDGFQENKKHFPNLQYRPVMDSQTRPAHAKLDGLILPMNDPFWARNFPPNGYNCRCSVTQTSKPVREIEAAKDYVPEKGFDFNPGIDRKLFSDNNSYQDTYKAAEQKKITKEAEKLLNNESGN